MDLSLGLRCFLLTLIGLCAGGLANHVISTYAYITPRPISPWTRQKRWLAVPEKHRPESWTGDWWDARSWLDCIPFIGWLRLTRESSVHGRGFWVRPLLIELAMAIGLPAQYHYEALAGGLLPPAAIGAPGFLATYEPVGTTIFFAHAILVTLMVAATFIDLDEKTIPDIITIPGTWMGLIAGTISTSIFMPTTLPVGGQVASVKETTFDSPWFGPSGAWFGGSGFLIGVLIWSVWCFALADRRWSGMVARRRGLGRAIRHFINGLFHYGSWKILLGMWAVGFLLLLTVFKIGGTSWQGLFTSLVGLAVGGGIVWAIRIIASWAMNMEAMGFGDVTLMAMIGAFIGWQGSLSAFFLAPFTAIFIVIIQYIITRDAQVPFGPYLCAGTLLTILKWDSVYNGWFAFNLLTLGPMLLWISVSMLGLMGVMLFVWRQIKYRLIYPE
jgi:prepilin signal peptidase PulO-like enzyme (type II secretory pathway)